MATTQRERYRSVLAALDQARQRTQRAVLLHQVSLNRLRQAEVEGFEAEATQREATTDGLATQLDRARQEVLALTRQAEEQRLLAVAEEIDEVIAEYDAALEPLVALVATLAASVATAAAVAERAAALAADLPASAHDSQRRVAATTARAATLARQVAALQTTLTRSDQPPPSAPAA